MAQHGHGLAPWGRRFEEPFDLRIAMLNPSPGLYLS